MSENLLTKASQFKYLYQRRVLQHGLLCDTTELLPVPGSDIAHPFTIQQKFQKMNYEHAKLLQHVIQN